MKLFVTTFKNFTLMGIGSGQKRINAEMLIALLFLWLTSIFNTTFLLYEANNFKESFGQIACNRDSLKAVSAIFNMAALNRNNWRCKNQS